MTPTRGRSTTQADRARVSNPRKDNVPTDLRPPTSVIYLRVSTKEQAERGGDAEGFSIPAQRLAAQRKAEALGAEVVAEFVDRDRKSVV